MKNFLLLCCVLLPAVQVFSQAVSWELSAEPGDQASSAASFQSSNFNNSVLTRGAGLTAVTGAGSMNASGWFSGSTPTTLNDAIANNDFYAFTVNTENCLFFNPTTINIVLRSSATGPSTATLRCSSDGFSTDIGTVTVGTTSSVFTFPETLSPNTASITYRLYGYGGAAGGGTPSSGGTMRIGSSTTAGDNDLEVFASVTFIAVQTVANITVNAGDMVPQTVLNTNVPGAVASWSRSTESIGLVPVSGTGNISAFTAVNNTGAPVTCTITASATLGSCVGPDMVFTITVNPAPCMVTAVNFSGNPSPCNDNGTPNDPSDDFFTQNIQAIFFNRPITGSLQIAPGGDQIGTYAIPVNNISGNSHIFSNVAFKADGTPTVITINFTDAPACSRTQSGTTVPPCSAPMPCSINSVSLQNAGPCNDNGTSDPADDYFTADVTTTFTSPPATGLLEIELPGDVVPGGGATSIPVGNLVGNTHTFTGVRFKADGTVTVVEMQFSADNGCVRTGTGPIVQPCSVPCSVNSIVFQNVGSCHDNGTSDPADDYFTANVTTTFTSPPATGLLEIELPGDVVPGGGATSIPVGNLLGNTHTFTGVRFKADGTVTVVEMQFSADNGCVRTGAGPIVQPCSFAPPVLSCPAHTTVSCAANVPPANPASVSETHDCPGNVTIITLVDQVSGLSCTNRFQVNRIYQATDQCGKTASCSQIITVNDQTPPSMTCPAGQTVSCLEQVPASNIGSVTGLSDNCGGATPTVTFVGETLTNQTCANRFTVNRTYRATDACGNSATCVQIITVNDQTPPTFTSVPPNVTVDCYLVPGVGVATAGDNCSSGATVSFLGEVRTPGVCPVLYILTRTWRATDACGNSATAAQVVNVTDTHAPQFLALPKNKIVECGPENADEFQKFLNDFGGAVVEDCTQITYTHVDSPIQPTNYQCGHTFQKNIRFIATDECGNTSFLDALFTVADLTPPVFVTPPQNVALECDDTYDNGEMDFYNWLDSNAGLVAADACGDVTVDKVLINETKGCGNTWKKTYEFRAWDECSNFSKTTATFAVVDNTPPTIVCPPNDNVYLPCLEDVPAADPSGLDVWDCSGATTTLKYSWSDGTGCPVWPMTVVYHYSAKDACGNEATCERAYYVRETRTPALLCPDTIKLPCVDDIPGPLQLFNYVKNLLQSDCAGGFSSITILADSGLPQGSAKHRTYTINAKNHCGLATSTCAVTFLATGNCNQFCTATQASWGDPNGVIGNMSTEVALTQLIQAFGPVKVGGGGSTVFAADPNCVQELLFGNGNTTFLPTGHFSCPLPPALANPDGSLNNQLAANAMGLQLNIWYNLKFNNRDLGIQHLNNLPPCLVEFPLLKALGQHATLQDLLNLTNEYLQNYAVYYAPDLPALLNAALDNLNAFRVDCGLNAPCERPNTRSNTTSVQQSSNRLYPNPTTGMTMLAFFAENEGPATLKISGARGQESEQQVVLVKGLNQAALSLKNLPAGVYWVTVQGASSMEALRLVKVGE